MNHNEAYQILKKSFPDCSAMTCAVCGDIYAFNMVPDSLQPTPGGVGIYDNSWGVDKNTGEIKRLPVLENLEMLSNATIIEL